MAPKVMLGLPLTEAIDMWWLGCLAVPRCQAVSWKKYEKYEYEMASIPPFLLIIWGVIYFYFFYFWWGRGCSLIDLIKLASFKKFWIKVLSYFQMNYIVKTQGQPPDLQLSAGVKLTFTFRKILKVPGNARYCYLKALYLCTCFHL